MDEYLFIAQAKLNADRLCLEHRQRAAQPRVEQEIASRPSESSRSSWLSPEPQWKEQS
jgi:hypothetical protein